MRPLLPARDPSRALLATDPPPRTTRAASPLRDILLRATIDAANPRIDDVVLSLVAGLTVPLNVSVPARGGGRLGIPVLLTFRDGDMSMDIVGDPPCLCRIASGAASACLSRPPSSRTRGAA